MAASYKPPAPWSTLKVAGLLCGRRGLRHELDDVAGLQGNVHPAQQLAGLDAGRDAVVHNDDLARVFGAVVIGGHHGLGQRHTLGPGDDAVADFAIDGDAGCLSLLHVRDGLLLPRHACGARPGVSLALGNTAAKEDSEQQDAQTDWTGLKHPTTNIQHRTSKDCYSRKHWLLDVGCWMLDVGCWMLDVGCWMLVVGCWLFWMSGMRGMETSGHERWLVVSRSAATMA